MEHLGRWRVYVNIRENVICIYNIYLYVNIFVIQSNTMDLPFRIHLGSFIFLSLGVTLRCCDTSILPWHKPTTVIHVMATCGSQIGCLKTISFWKMSFAVPGTWSMALLNDERFARKNQGLYSSNVQVWLTRPVIWDSLFLVAPAGTSCSPDSVVVYKQTFLDCSAQTPPGK